MPSITASQEEQDNANQKMWKALKRHIIRERQKKKEEYEAEVEEARLKKEREARERQDVMTLEETKEQIEQLQQKLKQLDTEKQQLFMQLKKVLNEDEKRKQKQQKESNELAAIKMQQMSNMPMPMFSIPPSPGPGEQQGRPPPLTSHMMNKQQMVRSGVQAGVKRQRSPSPTYALHMQRLHQPPHKHQPVYPDHKMEDNRGMSRQLSRAVLWNKPASYSTGVGGTGAYYTLSSSGHGHSGHGHSHGHGGHGTERPLLYAQPPPPLLYAQPLYIDMMNNSQQIIDNKDQSRPPQVLIGLSEPHHPAVSVSGISYVQSPSTRHLSIHPSSHNNIQVSKSGSIPGGYGVQPNPPSVQTPPIFTSRNRY